MADLLSPQNGIVIYKGSSKTLDLQVLDQNNSPVNITGSTITLTVRKKAPDLLPLIFKSSTDATQVIITFPEVGKAQIFILPSDTKTLDARVYVFDIWITLGSGLRYPIILPSDFEILQPVTIL